jgi:hypothetical protein
MTPFADRGAPPFSHREKVDARPARDRMSGSGSAPRLCAAFLGPRQHALHRPMQVRERKRFPSPSPLPMGEGFRAVC